MLITNPDFPVGNAAGWCKTVEDVRLLVASAADFITVGGYTPLARSGNPGNTFNGDTNQGLNSRGLPCGGIAYLEAHGREMVEVARGAAKKIILNMNGFLPTDYAALTMVASNAGFAGVEVNLACPNVVEGAKRKPIFFFDLGLSRRVIAAVSDVLPEHMFMLVKVSIESNPEYVVKFADMLRKFPRIYGLVASNTFPNCLLFNDDGAPQIETPDKTGWAGGSGYQLKAFALGQVSQWRKALPQSILVIGAGGVACNPRPGERKNDYGHDVADMLRAGASAVQVGTAYFTYGPMIFSEIAEQYINLKQSS